MKRNLLLQRDYILFDPLDQISQVSGETPASSPLIMFRKTAAFGITLSCYGTIGHSDLTGEKTVEDLEIWLGDGEITNGLPENFIQELVSACIEENP